MKRRQRRITNIATPLLAMMMAFAFLGILVVRPGTTFLGIGTEAAFFSALAAMPEGGLAYLEGRLEGDTQAVVEEMDDPPSVPEEEPIPSVEETPEEAAPNRHPTDGTGSLSYYEEPAVLPVPVANRGTIVREQYAAGSDSAGYVKLKSGYLRNVTSLTDAEVEAEIEKDRDFSLQDTDEPQVLIYHTHATESYEPVTRDYFDKEEASGRSTDNDQNVTRVGEVIAAQLEALGIGVVHDRTQHDYPSYNGSYDRSRETIEKYLEEYPSIKIILDVHRDALEEEDGTRIAPAATIEGRSAAQVMIIAGCDDGTLGNDYWPENLRFAADLQSNMESMFPGLTRPILFDYRRYNQHLMPGALLLEVGGHGNSMSEALYAGELIGKALAATLRSYIETESDAQGTLSAVDGAEAIQGE